jgi:tRNA (mo5U34)-methyltransferase
VKVWGHSIDLGHGVVTPGRKSAARLQAEVQGIRLPDVTGKSVLDVGAWDGFFSFEAERRGACRVVALDQFVWSLELDRLVAHVQECQEKGILPRDWQTVPHLWHPDTLPGKKGFDTARQALDSKVESVTADFMEIDLDVLGRFDVVLFLGVLDHVQDPFRALRRLAAVTREMAIIETAGVMLPGLEAHALCEFYETTEPANDPSNWWAPNPRALVGMLRAAGFRTARVLTPLPDEQTLPRRQMVRCRLTAHAWK